MPTKDELTAMLEDAQAEIKSLKKPQHPVIITNQFLKELKTYHGSCISKKQVLVYPTHAECAYHKVKIDIENFIKSGS